MGLFDWLSRGRGQNAQPIVWEVRREGEQVVVEDGRGAQHRVALNGARFVRVVPLSGVQSHVVAQTRGWQVTLSRPEGDVLVGPALSDWRSAIDLAHVLCERLDLPLDETTQRMFSRVGQFSGVPPRA